MNPSAAEPDTPDRPERAPSPGARPAVLMVDDHPENLMVLEGVLDGEDLELVKANSGQEALRLLLQREFAVILLDVMMPVMDGFETARLVRERARSQHTPIIFLSAVGTGAEHVFRGYELGAVDYIAKPISPQILRSKVRVFVDLYRMTVQTRQQAEQLRQLERRGYELELAEVSLRAQVREREHAERAAADLGQKVRELRESEAFLQSTLDALSKYIAILDGSGAVIATNAAWRLAPDETQLFGPGFPVGASYLERLVEVGPERLDAARMLASGIREVLGDRLNTLFVEYGGEGFEDERWYSLRVNRFMQCGAVRVVVAHEDITMRKRAEQQRTEYAAKLELSNRELQDFASVAAHDLQEPLRKITVFGDRLRSACGDQLTDKGLDYLQRMQHASQRMQNLISDLLAFSRVTTKAQPFHPVSLGEVVRDVVSDLEVRIEQAGGRVDVPEPLPTIDADALQMRQLLQNLIGNALKFHRPDVPPVVVVRAVIVHASGSLERGESCRLSVEDNGIGFDDKYLDRIFTVFQRLHGRGQYEGTGIGLAICRKIAERHGGSITAHSIPGQGATFVVTLPVHRK